MNVLPQDRISHSMERRSTEYITCAQCGEFKYLTLLDTNPLCSLPLDKRVQNAGSTQLGSSNELNTLMELVAVIDTCFGEGNGVQGDDDSTECESSISL